MTRADSRFLVALAMRSLDGAGVLPNGQRDGDAQHAERQRVVASEPRAADAAIRSAIKIDGRTVITSRRMIVHREPNQVPETVRA